MDELQKYSQKPLKDLKNLAQKYFNEYIRLRDTDENGFGRCISCLKTVKFGDAGCHAGHFYSAGQFPSLRFNEQNTNSQCLQCNYFKSGNLLSYRINLIKKIGQAKFESLEIRALASKREFLKRSIFDYIDVIIKYKELCKTMKNERY